jgi:hypothetical protein
MWLEGLGKLKKEKSNEPIGNRIRDLPAYSIAPQPITLPRANETLWHIGHTGAEAMNAIELHWAVIPNIKSVMSSFPSFLQSNAERVPQFNQDRLLPSLFLNHW